MTKSRLKILIKTFGCQMNSYDSQLAAGLLEKEGFEVIQEQEAEKDPDGKLSRGADVVLMNTCSVRDHAEQRVWGRLGMLGLEKSDRPDLIIGLMGCMVEEHREALFKRFPQLDIMIGTRNIKELPSLIRKIHRDRHPMARIKREGLSVEYSEYTKRDHPYHAWLPIMTGCDKVCTFCIVPKTRGAEVSMPLEQVLQEARRLAIDGVKWITLLGQNVNSYGQSGGLFPKLLEEICSIEGLERISFTTSHPSDATETLFQVIAKQPKISRRFHLPLQSGSDRILKRMKRLHTFAEFKATIERLRQLVPDISITTDIIVGFPGETDDDYEATRMALEALRFDGAFIYKYSARPGTPASNLPDDVPFAVKSRRNQELLDLQKKITQEINRLLVGKTLTGFVEGIATKNAKEWTARTDQEKRIVFLTEKDLRGRFVRFKIDSLRGETLRGVVESAV